MTWIQVESSDVVAIGWEENPAAEEAGAGMMGITFHRPPGSTYLYYDVPKDFYEEFLAAPSKGQFVNRVIKASGLAFEKIA